MKTSQLSDRSINSPTIQLINQLDSPLSQELLQNQIKEFHRNKYVFILNEINLTNLIQKQRNENKAG